MSLFGSCRCALISFVLENHSSTGSTGSCSSDGRLHQAAPTAREPSDTLRGSRCLWFVGLWRGSVGWEIFEAHTWHKQDSKWLACLASFISSFVVILWVDPKASKSSCCLNKFTNPCRLRQCAAPLQESSEPRVPMIGKAPTNPISPASKSQRSQPSKQEIILETWRIRIQS